MPNLLSVGTATSARQVVGLQAPPKNTSGALLQSVGLSSSLPASFDVCSLDDPLKLVYALSFRDVMVCGLCIRKRFKSAASTQNSPNVNPFMCRFDRAVPRASNPLCPRRANNLAVCNISLTVKQKNTNKFNNDTKHRVIVIQMYSKLPTFSMEKWLIERKKVTHISIATHWLTLFFCWIEFELFKQFVQSLGRNNIAPRFRSPSVQSLTANTKKKVTAF